MFNSITKYCLILLGCTGLAVSGPDYLGFRVCKDPRTRLSVENPEHLEKPIYCKISENISAWRPTIIDEDVFFFGSILLVAVALVMPVQREWDGSN